MEQKAVRFLSLNLMFGLFDVSSAIIGRFAVPALPGSRNHPQNCRPFPTNGTQLYHALEEAFNNIHAVGLEGSAHFTPGGVLSFSQLDQQQWPMSKDQFLDTFVADSRIQQDLEEYLRRQQKLDKKSHDLQLSQEDINARRQIYLGAIKQLTKTEKRLQDLEEDFKRTDKEQKVENQILKHLTEDLEERRLQDPEEDLSRKELELEERRASLQHLEKVVKKKEEIYHKTRKELAEEEERLQVLEQDLSMRQQEQEEQINELNDLQADLDALRRLLTDKSGKLAKVQCLFIGSTHSFGDFIATDSFQSSVCQKGVPLCWEAPTQWGTPNPIETMGPEGGADKACNRIGGQDVYRVKNHADMYRLWRHMYRAGDNKPVWIHGFRTNKREHESVTLDDYQDYGRYCGVIMKAGGQVLSVDCHRSGIYYVCNDVHHIRLIN